MIDRNSGPCNIFSDRGKPLKITIFRRLCNTIKKVAFKMGHYNCSRIKTFRPILGGTTPAQHLPLFTLPFCSVELGVINDNLVQALYTLALSKRPKPAWTLALALTQQNWGPFFFFGGASLPQVDHYRLKL